MKYVADLQCLRCGRTHDPQPRATLCPSCGDGLLDLRYDYERVRREWSKELLAASPEQGLWRWLPLLPVNPATPRPNLRVGGTPLYNCPQFARQLGVRELYIKDDGLNPTASLKDRASTLAVVKAAEAGSDVIACSSTGNAASSLAGNVAAFGGRLKTVIFVPRRVPQGKVAQLLIFGATVISVDGDYQAAFNLSTTAIERWGWYNRNAAINPYMVEGKKTSVLEVAEQLKWQMPDWIVLSVGDGCTIGGAYKALKDLKEIGFIDKMPRLAGIQAEGCAPLYRSWRTGSPLAPETENTLADSIAVGVPRNPDKAFRAIKETGGVFATVSDEEILGAMGIMGRNTGVFAEPASAAGLAGLIRLISDGVIQGNESVVLVSTGNGLKDISNALKAAGEPIKIDPDVEALAQELSRRNL